jgi:hypothetical protein
MLIVRADLVLIRLVSLLELDLYFVSEISTLSGLISHHFLGRFVIDEFPPGYSTIFLPIGVNSPRGIHQESVDTRPRRCDPRRGRYASQLALPPSQYEEIAGLPVEKSHLREMLTRQRARFS